MCKVKRKQYNQNKSFTDLTTTEIWLVVMSYCTLPLLYEVPQQCMQSCDDSISVQYVAW